MTLGSLFDGIGGFPLAAVRNDIVPLWASEIEPFPLAVTKLRFPDMLPVGDITALDGAKLPPVDIITGGSPCQDLSVAGARAGLAGARSGLFMEQIRIVKEMRDADLRRGRTGVSVHPRYMVWENVPGAFSSAGGEDFRVVLEEIVRVRLRLRTVPDIDEPTMKLPHEAAHADDAPSAPRGIRQEAEQEKYSSYDADALHQSVTRLLHHMGNIFRANALPPTNPAGIRMDSKRRKKLQEKRMALGQKLDDHEMTM